jgi:hypothetical protein
MSLFKNPSHVGLEIKTKNKNPTYLALFLNPLSENQNIFLDGLIYQIYCVFKSME